MKTGDRIWLAVAIFFLLLFLIGTIAGASLAIYRMMFL